MPSKLTFAAIVAATLGIASLQAFAAAPTPYQSEHAEASATRHAAITPTKAVAIVKRGGGAVYGFGMESEHTGHWYEVDVLRHGQPTIVRIDPNNGHVIGTSRAHGEDAAGAHALSGSLLKLGPAIAAAERKANGPAMEATAIGSGAQAAVIVDIASAHGIEHYRVAMHGVQMRVTKIAHDPTDD